MKRSRSVLAIVLVVAIVVAAVLLMASAKNVSERSVLTAADIPETGWTQDSLGPYRLNQFAYQDATQSWMERDAANGSWAGITATVFHANSTSSARAEFDRYKLSFLAPVPGNGTHNATLDVADEGFIVYDLNTPPYFDRSCEIVLVKGSVLVTMSLGWTDDYPMADSFPAQIAKVQADKILL